MTVRVVVDARCLQDPNYSMRGVGQHGRALLRFRERVDADLQLTAVLDRDLPPLAIKDRELFDDRRTTAYVPSGDRCVFLSPSPMTHSPLPMARLLMLDNPAQVAIVHDFIPYDLSKHYLTTPSNRIDYNICLAWLRRFKHFFPNSQYTSQRLRNLLNIPAWRCTVTGVSVRESLVPTNGVTNTPGRSHEDRFVLVVGGGDPRKNPEVVLTAHGGSARLAAAGIRLLIAGAYPENMQRSLRDVHEQAGGRSELLQFLPRIADDELRACYATALCTVAPSRIEGFSIPIVEASANGCPVLASNCAAQAELLADQEDLFDSDDSETLRYRLERLVFDPSVRERARTRQADIWQRFTEKEVGSRFWREMLNLHVASPPAVLRGNRPRIAFLSPMPPAASGVADYSFASLGPLAARADVEVFSDTPDARVPAAARFAGGTDALAHLHPRFDAVISVIGNSHFHLREFELLMRYGSAAIAHDARMLGFYRILLGEDRAIAAASAELGRPVSREELDGWLADESRLQALFLKEITEAANPIIVHSPVTERYIAAHYGRASDLLPFVPYRSFGTDELSTQHRALVRNGLGLSPRDIVIASFGTVHQNRALHDCLWALEMLLSWRIPARLVLVGDADKDIARSLRCQAATIGVSDALVLFERRIEEEEYKAWLIAADVGVQLRTYQLGGLSGALLDCIAAALPTVVNEHLAKSVDAPPYVRCVPDAISAVLVAEQIASIVDERQDQTRPLTELVRFLSTRNFNVYADQLLSALQIG